MPNNNPKVTIDGKEIIVDANGVINGTIKGNELTIDASGIDRSAEVTPEGQPGSGGGHARPITAALASDPSDPAKFWLSVSTARIADLPAAATKYNGLEIANIKSIRFLSNGGAGAKGGEGKQGSPGNPGAPGADATRTTAGTDGQNGGEGGKGYQGGTGGSGGDGAITELHIKPVDLQHLIRVSTNVSEGNGGPRGEGGKGGKGGKGGAGGQALIWHETVTEDENGKELAVPRQEKRQQPAGNAGDDGKEGKQGEPGERDGNPGRPGEFRIVVPGMGTFSSIYSLAVEQFPTVVSRSTGLFEPGGTYEISHLVFNNPSAMPTPQNIQVRVVQNNWIAGAPGAVIPVIDQHITSSAPYLVQAPVVFTIKRDQAPLVDNTTFSDTAKLHVMAWLDQVKRFIPESTRKSITLPIRYPVELSTIACEQTVGWGDEAPFAFKVRNISAVNIGTGANERAAYVEFECLSPGIGNSMRFTVKNGARAVSFADKLTQNLKIKASNHFTFSGSIDVMNPALPDYTVVDMAVTLYLSDPADPAEFHPIQRRKFSIQYAKGYSYDENADFVLVTNNRTTRDQVMEWQGVINGFGSNVSFWSVTSYKGLRFTQKRLSDGRSFMDQLYKRVIIILNNDYTVNSGESRKATELLEQQELFDAARERNIGTYIVGGRFDMVSEVVPPVVTNPDVPSMLTTLNRTETVSKQLAILFKPEEKHLSEQAAVMQRSLRKKSPTFKYRLVAELKPENLGHPQGNGETWFGRALDLRHKLVVNWNIGTIESCPGLEQNVAHIIHREETEGHVDEHDIYHLIKLLPFEKKLQYFQRRQTRGGSFVELSNAICSDLLGELLAFSQNTGMNEATQEQIARGLRFLNKLIDVDNNHLVADEYLKKLLQQYFYFIDRVTSTSDAFLGLMHISGRSYRYVLANICSGKLNAMYEKLFPVKDHGRLKDSLAAMQETWGKKTSLEDLFQQFPSSEKHAVIDYQVDFDQFVWRRDVRTVEKKGHRFTEGVNFFQPADASEEAQQAAATKRLQAIEAKEAATTFELPARAGVR